ncbi:MAG: hypothetical protein DRI48_11060 [Chloroflexi bacterium]|nr:MAG: hypothetical protein DRI48_11060 [Chloroflexota bacterium]
MHVIQVTDPSAPTEVGSYETSRTGWSLALAGNYAYVADSGSPPHGLHVVSVADPAHPTEVGFYQVEGVPDDMAVAGGRVYIADELLLHIVDVSNPTQPAQVGAFEELSWGIRLDVAGEYAYVTDEYRGMHVIHVADPTQPAEVGFWDAPKNAVGLAVRGNHAYVTGGSSGLHILDISNPANPVQVGGYDTPGTAFRVTLAGQYAYVADWEGGLRIIDISDPAHPIQVGSFTTSYYGMDVAVAGQYAYLAEADGDADGGYLRILNVSDPAHPTEVGVFFTGPAYGIGRGVALFDHYAYFAHGSTTSVLDVFDPANPTKVTDLYGGYDAAVFGDRLYIADSYSDVTVYDLSNPAAPAYVNGCKTWSWARQVVAAGDYLYVADRSGGVAILGTSTLQVQPMSLGWMVADDGADPPPRTVRVESSGSPITWTAGLSPTVGWLTAAPLSGTTPAAITVTAHISGLAVGRYTSTLVITGPTVSRAQVVSITLIVADEVYGLYLPLVTRQ